MKRFALIGLLLFWAACLGAHSQGRDRSHCIDADDDGNYANVAQYCATEGYVDCDDNDPTRFVGNSEYLDPQNKDDDCNANTTGLKLGDYAGGQICDGENVALLKVFNPPSGARGVYFDQYTTSVASCGPGLVCIPQPNGTGVCSSKPSAYKTPDRFIYTTPQRMSVAGMVNGAAKQLPIGPSVTPIAPQKPVKPIKPTEKKPGN
jgi:hypothetical protein